MATEKKYISADEFLLDAWRLAAAVRQSGWRPDWLVALWRGGAFAGIAVHEFLQASGWAVEHLPLKCRSYSGIGEATGRVEFTFGDASKMLNLGEALIYAFATALGYGLAMILFAGLREHLALNDVPKSFKGIPIALITVGILALAFMGFAGIA